MHRKVAASIATIKGWIVVPSVVDHNRIAFATVLASSTSIAYESREVSSFEMDFLVLCLILTFLYIHSGVTLPLFRECVLVLTSWAKSRQDFYVYSESMSPFPSHKRTTLVPP